MNDSSSEILRNKGLHSEEEIRKELCVPNEVPGLVSADPQSDDQQGGGGSRTQGGLRGRGQEGQPGLQQHSQCAEGGR